MKPYNSKLKCPKCGHDKVLSRYTEKFQGYLTEKWQREEDGFPLTEFIKRICDRCQYKWPQKVKP